MQFDNTCVLIKVTRVCYTFSAAGKEIYRCMEKLLSLQEKKFLAARKKN